MSVIGDGSSSSSSSSSSSKTEGVSMEVPKPPTTNRWKDFDGVSRYIENAYRILETHPHDEASFTQGLYWESSTQKLVESTGMYGASLVRRYAPSIPHTVENEWKIPPQYFGEGLCWFNDKDGNDRFVLLTWKEQTGMVLDVDTLQPVSEFRYNTHTTEGWGVTFDPLEKVFHVTDGSEWVQVWNLDFEEIRKYEVTIRWDQDDGTGTDGRPVKHMNELEWDVSDQTLLANLWYQNLIVRIQPETGKILRVYDFSDLYPQDDRTSKSDSFNGIAIETMPNTGVASTATTRLWITGKYWPYLYHVELLES